MTFQERDRDQMDTTKLDFHRKVPNIFRKKAPPMEFSF